MTKVFRVAGAALAAVAVSLLFVAGALAQPDPTVSVEKWAADEEGAPVTSLPASGGEVWYWYKVTNTSDGPGGSEDFQSVSLADDPVCDPIEFDSSSDESTEGDKLKAGEWWLYSCGPVELTETTTNTVTVWACKDSSKQQCNNEDHSATAQDSYTVTVGSSTSTVDDLARGAGAAMVALILLAIGALGFLGTTNRLPKLPRIG